MSICQTASQPYRLSHIHALRVNLPYFHGLNLVIFSKWKIDGFEKMTFFNPLIFNSNFFLFHPHVKSIYSEKATKFCEIFTLLFSYVVPVKSKVKISQNFVAFSEYMNFKSITNYGIAWMGLNLYEHHHFQPKIRCAYSYATQGSIHI